MRVLPLLLALAAGAAADPAAPALAPDAAVAGWIRAIKANDLAAIYAGLPASRQQALGQSLRAGPPGNGAPAGAPGGAAGNRGGRGPRGGQLGMLRMLGDPERSGAAGGIAAGVLAEVANQVMPAGAATVAGPAAPPDQPWLAFMPRMAAMGVATAPVTQILAAGLETRQIAAIDGWWQAYAAWARTAKLDQPATASALAAPLAAVLKEAEAVGEAADAADAAKRLSAVLQPVKQSLLAVGLDADAALGGASVATESATATGAVVVVSFPAFGSEHRLPLKLELKEGAWTLDADSPALRWLAMPGAGRPGGFPGGNRPGRRGGQGPDAGPGQNGGPQLPPPGKPDSAF